MMYSDSMDKDLEQRARVKCSICGTQFDTLLSNMMTFNTESKPWSIRKAQEEEAVCIGCIESFNRQGLSDSSFPPPEGAEYLEAWVLDYLRGRSSCQN